MQESRRTCAVAACEQRVGNDVEDHASNGVQRRNSQPENAEQVNVFLHAPAASLHRNHRTDDLLAAAAAECLPSLHRDTTSVAEHDFLPHRSVTPCASPTR